MERLRNGRSNEPSWGHVLGYVADLELEVDRLRRHHQLIYVEARALVTHLQQLCGEGNGSVDLVAVDRASAHLAEVLHDLRDLPGYHPAHDQVVAIAIRPLIEQVFRWQQRLLAAPQVKMALELEIDHMEWFPGRLRRIVDILISNAVRYHDPAKDESWVRLGLRETAENYELRVVDNGTGLPDGMKNQAFDLFRRASLAHMSGLGLPCVKLLIEQCGGSLTVDAGEGQGTTVVALLPRFAIDDFLV